MKGTVVDEPRFHIHLIDTKRDKMGEWSSVLLEKEIINIRPDVVYFIGGHTARPLMQILNLRKKMHFNNMKVMAFSSEDIPLLLILKNQNQVLKSILIQLANR